MNKFSFQERREKRGGDGSSSSKFLWKGKGDFLLLLKGDEIPMRKILVGGKEKGGGAA